MTIEGFIMVDLKINAMVLFFVYNNASSEMGPSRIIKNIWNTENTDVDCPVSIIFHNLIFPRFVFQCIMAVSQKKMF